MDKKKEVQSKKGEKWELHNREMNCVILPFQDFFFTELFI